MIFFYDKGALCRTLEGHGHWVNSLTLNSDYIIRTGAFDPKDATFEKRTVTDSKKSIFFSDQMHTIFV